MQKERLVEIRNLSIAFEREGEWNEVVSGIDLDINRGETLGMVGESGSGKSVSSLAIMGLLPGKKSRISSGEIIFDGVDLLSIGPNEHRRIRGRRIAMIFQEPMTSLNPTKRCGHQVEEAILVYNSISRKQAKKRVLELFEEVRLPNIERIYRAYPHELSGGQKQRVMIAMALSCNPELLIADEPTTALDVSVQNSILELLKNIQTKHGISILFITHDLGVIRQIADRVAVIYRGEIVEEGLAKDIFNSPRQPYTQGLISSRPPIDSRPRRLVTVQDFLGDKNIETDLITKEEREGIHKEIYSNPPLLSIKDLEVEFIIKKSLLGRTKSSIRAVDSISFDLYKGETLGLVGESGCGKTTVGRSIMNLIDSSLGRVEIDGINLLDLKGKELREYRKKVQIIFQDPYSSLNSRISIGNAISEAMTVHNMYGSRKERKEKTIELLKKVGLEEEHYNRYPHEFSGGQRQRIGIARALSINPEIVICDESVSALDVSVQAQVLNLINDLKRDFGFTCIFISHDLSVVKYMSDRILVMEKGRLVELDEADKVYYSPKSEYTSRLIESIPL